MCDIFFGFGYPESTSVLVRYQNRSLLLMRLFRAIFQKIFHVEGVVIFQKNRESLDNFFKPNEKSEFFYNLDV